MPKAIVIYKEMISWKHLLPTVLFTSFIQIKLIKADKDNYNIIFSVWVQILIHKCLILNVFVTTNPIDFK